MNREQTIPEDLLMKHGEEVEAVFRRAVRHALWQHKQLGQSIAISRNGQVVVLPPEEILVTDEDCHPPTIENHVYAEN